MQYSSILEHIFGSYIPVLISEFISTLLVLHKDYKKVCVAVLSKALGTKKCDSAEFFSDFSDLSALLS